MATRVYFTAHADDEMIIDEVVGNMQRFWSILSRCHDNGSCFDEFWDEYAKFLEAPWFEHIANILRRKGTPREHMLAVAKQMLGMSAFLGASACWPHASQVQLELEEAHAKIIDLQIERYELSQSERTFFALAHFNLGAICRELDAEFGPGKSIAVPVGAPGLVNKAGARAFSMLDILAPLYTEIKSGVGLRTPSEEKARFASSRLALGAQRLFVMAEHLQV